MNRKLTDILSSSSARQQLAEQWDRTEAAADFAPLPSGTYTAHVHAVELFTARTGTPGVKIQFRIAEGEHTGRMIFHDCWLTPAALPQTKRDCGKLGLHTVEQLESANVPPGRIRCKLRLTLRTGDDGGQQNRVRTFDVLGLDEPTADAFAPGPQPAETPEPPPVVTGTADAELPPDADGFPFGANAGGGE